MQKTILLVLFSLFSLILISRSAALTDVRECLPTTGAAEVASVTINNPTSIATNADGSFIWVVSGVNVTRYAVLQNGQVILGSAVRIGKRALFPNGTCEALRRSICTPVQVYVDVLDRLWVTDSGLRRVIMFFNASASDFSNKTARPDLLIGANSWNGFNAANNISSFNLTNPQSVAYYQKNDTLYIADSRANGTGGRVLIYELISQQPNFAVSAERVLGQTSLNSLSSGSNNAKFAFVSDVSVDQKTGDLFVVDKGNDRVLLFTEAQNAANGATAHAAIGQSSTSSNSAATSSKGVRNVTQATFDSQGNQLFVADSGNNRVVVVSKATSVSNGPTFTVVLGQGSFQSSNTSASSTGLNNPTSVAFSSSNTSGSGFIFVADTNNNRVVAFGPCENAVASPSHSVSKHSATVSVSLAASVPSTSASPNTQSPSASTASFSFLASHFSKSGAGSTSAAPSAPSPSSAASLSPVQLTTTGSSSSTGTTGTTGARRLRRRL
jgi:hypothetical protein